MASGSRSRAWPPLKTGGSPSLLSGLDPKNASNWFLSLTKFSFKSDINLHVGVPRLVASLIRLYLTKNMWLLLCREAVESILVKLETSHTLILPTPQR